MGNRNLSLGLAALTISLLSCGDDGGSSTTCGTGTTLVNGTCVADPGTECGPGTVLENGTCVVSSTPPTCGPGTKLENNTCVVDRSAPGPVTGLAATVSGSNINLSWTAGESSTGTLIVRTTAGAYDAPAPGVTYTAGMTLPGGSTVVSVGNATTASDAFTTPGRYSYVAWSQNASGNYGFGREASAVATIPAQNGVITLDVPNATATVTTQPALVALAAANFAFNSGTGTVTFDLSATNNTAGHLFNIKAIVRSVSAGTVTNQTGTLANGDKFVTIGFAATVPGIAQTKTITMSGVTATDVITMNVELVESGLGIVGNNVVDQLGGAAIPGDLPETSGNQNSSVYTDGFPSASGRYFYVTTRWHPVLFRIDTSDGSVTSVSPFVSGSASCVAFGADGFAYMSFQLGSHRRRNGYGLAIAKIDPISLTVVARREISAGNGSIGKGCAVAGNRFAATYGGQVYFADTATMAFVDADPGTAMTIDPVDSGAADTLRELVFAPNGATLYATASKNDLAIYAINPTTFAVSTYHTATTSHVRGLTVDGAGKLWWISDTGLSSFDGTTQATVPQGTAMTALLGFVGSKAMVTTSNGQALLVDTATGDTSAAGTISMDHLGHRGFLFATP